MDAYITALNLLSRRELSAAQLRQRLARRKFDPEQIEEAVTRLARDGTVDDRRVARATARLEGVVRGRGRRRVLQKVQQAGISEAVAREALDEVYQEVDEGAVLDKAIERRLRGASPAALDQKAMARIVRGLVGQGFSPAAIFARLRRRGGAAPDE